VLVVELSQSCSGGLTVLVTGRHSKGREGAGRVWSGGEGEGAAHQIISLDMPEINVFAPNCIKFTFHCYCYTYISYMTLKLAHRLVVEN
jgi:hypothetical protein